MISSAGRVCSASSRSASRPFRSPSTMRRSSRSSSGSAASSSALAALSDRASTPSNSCEEALQRVVTALARGAAVVDQVERDLPLLVGDLRHRQDLRRVHDRRVEAGRRRVSCRNTELSTCRAAGLRPKEMLERPRVVCTSGYSVLSCRIASIVSMPSRRVSSWPVAIGKVRVSTRMSPTRHPPVPGEVADEPVGDAHLPLGGAGLALLVDGQRDDGGAVLHDQRHDAADPGVRAVAVLVVDRVDDRPAAEHLQAGLEHRRARSSRARSAAWRPWRGGRPAPSCRPRRRGRRSRRRGRAGARRRGSGRGRSRRSRPSAARASPRGTPSSRWRWCARRSPGTRCPGGTAPPGRATPPRPRCAACAASTSRPRTRSTTCCRCSGVVPQQPPTRREAELAGEGVVRVGELGRAERVVRAVGGEHRQAGVRHARDADARRAGQVRRCSLISAGPVAQLRPITSTPSGSSAVSAAPISEPSSIVPVVSTVTWAKIGSATPASARARLAPTMAALACSRSWRSRRGWRRRRRRPARPPAAGTRRAARRTGRGPGWAAWCPGPPSRAPSAGAAGGRPVVGDPAGDRRAGLGELVDPLGDARTRRGWPGSRRRCWSRRSRRRPRSRRRGRSRPRRAGSR